MPEYKDYYKIMGVARDVGQDELKRVYRRLARKYHPDVSKEKDAEARFKEVQEAYEVLKDPQKRAAYDQLGSNWRQGQEFRPPPDWGQTVGSDGSLTVQAEDVTKVAHEITGWAVDHGISFERFEVSQPSLEDVYLELTDGQGSP